ncbi:unnamed protein product [Adineta ricciae]|uniref:Uncharacterized protein n=1 Tax=Adineta ricciae TaxID=249248 RepID=A0A815X8G2_ADIRI|nr:unnamed protein product [Adineta ricciae]
MAGNNNDNYSQDYIDKMIDNNIAQYGVPSDESRIRTSPIRVAEIDDGHGSTGALYLIGFWKGQTIYRTTHTVAHYMEGEEPGRYELHWPPVFPDVWVPECDVLQCDISVVPITPVLSEDVDNDHDTEEEQEEYDDGYDDDNNDEKEEEREYNEYDEYEYDEYEYDDEEYDYDDDEYDGYDCDDDDYDYDDDDYDYDDDDYDYDDDDYDDRNCVFRYEHSDVDDDELFPLYAYEDND